MGKLGLIITLILVIVGASLIMPNEAADIGKYLYQSAPQKISQTADAIYSIPPTPAWSHIQIGINDSKSENSEYLLNATSYSDRLYLLSDGSINLTVTTFP